jgi:hypothetical protein
MGQSAREWRFLDNRAAVMARTKKLTELSPNADNRVPNDRREQTTDEPAGALPGESLRHPAPPCSFGDGL